LPFVRDAEEDSFRAPPARFRRYFPQESTGGKTGFAYHHVVYPPSSIARSRYGGNQAGNPSALLRNPSNLFAVGP
jgi:hypothetical protein